ncbi:hypothetical protein PV10_06140 [Exophiala mesophila]|uniref:SAP domain-containing protein n=1 Tax=Exophiala mesophila TaxID=212818 RepID=A0A0D1ZAB9_EXOME|nr:uncharacterized protein PV10_06140 [Exophiala mesophila]KIV91622.1 hypothetical protein PV10_06140 [Exophiala mesophila]
MTDWSKLTVVNLKEECKARDIPLTGLKLKQHYIDRLQEYEAAENNGGDTDAGVEEAQVEEGDKTSQQANGHTTDDQIPTTETNTQEPDPSVLENSADPGASVVEEVQPAQPEEDTTDQRDIKPSESDSSDAQGKTTPIPKPEDPRSGQTSPEAELQPQTHEQTIPTLPPDEKQTEPSPEPTPTEPTVAVTAEELENKSESAESSEVQPIEPKGEPADDNQQPQTISDDPTVPSLPNEPSGVSDDQKNRRKRSHSPVPSSEEVTRKRFRLSDVQENAKIETDSEGASNRGPQTKLPHDGEGAAASASVDKSSEPPQRQDSPSQERDVTPAIHPATCSLYIRNFKRPLHVPTLRAHIAKLAQSRSDTSDADPITKYFVDLIRTHAFISFTSIAAASRVRTAMHETRFPDEPMREPLFVDFVPDDKIESWIEEETGSSNFGGRTPNRRFEVIYENGPDGVEAIFEEVGSRGPPHSSIPSRPSADYGRKDSLSHSTHPDREIRPPREDRRSEDHGRPAAPPAPPTGPRKSIGIGFKALDDLFPSTTAKPKLYYKPVSEEIAQARRELLLDLKDMGRSGEADMKRYSLERTSNGREDWVDKGPEFGRGKKGQDRLTGYRGGRFGGGGGGGYRGRGGDSWRGGGR